MQGCSRDQSDERDEMVALVAVGAVISPLRRIDSLAAPTLYSGGLSICAQLRTEEQSMGRSREMPFLEVKLWEGRTREQKVELARRLTDVLVEVAGCPREAVTIAFDDYARRDWAEGGRLCDEESILSAPVSARGRAAADCASATRSRAARLARWARRPAWSTGPWARASPRRPSSTVAEVRTPTSAARRAGHCRSGPGRHGRRVRTGMY